MKIKKNFSIQEFNTFVVDVKAKYFVEVQSIGDLQEVVEKFPKEKRLFLGEGSNTLFTKEWDGVIVKMNISGMNVIQENEEYVFVEVKAGEVWDEFVHWSVKNNYVGIESMVMIPGSVGGSITQNIGAYGQEIKDVLYSIEVLDVEGNKIVNLKPRECGFEYRYSDFKGPWRDKYVVTSATFCLEKTSSYYNIDYCKKYGRHSAIYEELENMAQDPYTIQDFVKAIKNQREKKLPSIEEYGTCGSFFKNPVIDFKQYEELEKKVSDIQPYPLNNSKEKLFKVPAGKLLEELGWRGYWEGNVGASEKHALCVVSNKWASGKEILKFTNRMRDSVKSNYGIELVEEVNIFY